MLPTERKFEGEVKGEGEVKVEVEVLLYRIIHQHQHRIFAH